jgi:hypothetical protein
MGDQKQEWKRGADGLDIRPGFRFHPSDEEIITSYLRPKVLDNNFTALAIGEADLNKLEPWELPCKHFYSYRICQFVLSCC